MMSDLKALKFSREHEWVRVEEKLAYIGITDFAQHALGNIVFVERPEVGGQLDAGEVLSVVESVKAASDVYSPVSGKVTEVNGELADEPEKLNELPYESWIAVLELKDVNELNNLMDLDAYEKFCSEEA
jgi:glycine cleavage system H protein